MHSAQLTASILDNLSTNFQVISYTSHSFTSVVFLFLLFSFNLDQGLNLQPYPTFNIVKRNISGYVASWLKRFLKDSSKKKKKISHSV